MVLAMMLLAAVIVVGALVAMASNRVPPVLALAVALAVAGLTGVAPPSVLFAGLSNGGVITVAAMLVIAKGVVKTGVISRVTWRLLRAVTTASGALRRLIGPVGLASSVMNTTPIVAMLVPASQELQQTRSIPARELLLPIAHATTLAGSVTLIGTSSNLLIAGIAAEHGVDVEMLSFAPVALPVCLVGWVVIMLLSPRMLRGSAPVATGDKDWRVELAVGPRALAVGRRAGSLGLADTPEFTLESIDRWGSRLGPTEVIHADDTLVFRATEAGVATLWANPRFGNPPQKLYRASVGIGEHGTLRDLEQEGYVEVVAARTKGSFREAPARPGAACYVTSGTEASLLEHDGFTVWQESAGRAPRPEKTRVALAVLLGVVVSASLGLAPVELLAFSGALLMVVTRVLTPRSAVRALDWNVLFILAGSVGLGGIVVESGLAAEIAAAMSYVAAGSVVAIVVVFTVTTAVLTNLVTNSAAASILTPVAIGIAAEYGISAVLLLALIGTCISFTFVNPFSHQSNLMVMGPGGYSTAAFARFGVPLLCVSMVTAVLVTYPLVALV